MENPIPRQRYGWSSVPQTTTEISVANTPRECIASHMNTIASPRWNSYLHPRLCQCCAPQKGAPYPLQNPVLSMDLSSIWQLLQSMLWRQQKALPWYFRKGSWQEILVTLSECSSNSVHEQCITFICLQKNNALYQVTHQNKMLVLKVIKIIS